MSYPPAVKDRPEIPSELIFLGASAEPQFRINVSGLIYLGDDHQKSGLLLCFLQVEAPSQMGR